MSHAFYDSLWREAIDELFDQIEIEIPPDKSMLPKENQDKYRFFATLYVRYLQIYKQLEEAQDRMIHAQKRQEVLELMDTVMGRLLELKIFLMKVKHSTSIDLDDVLLELHLTMDALDVPPPRNISDNKQEKLRRQEDLLRLLASNYGSPKAENIDAYQPAPMTFEEAIVIIQAAERARQGRERANFLKADRESELGSRTARISRTEAAILIQKTYKGWITRKKVKEMRLKEDILLGLVPPPPDERELDVLDKAAKIRKETQRRKEKQLVEAKQEQYNELLKKEGPKMAEEMKEKVRTFWEQTRLQTGQYPEEYFKEEEGGSKKFFHPELFPAPPPEPEEDDKKKKGKKDAKKEKKKEKKDTKKGKKGKKDEEEDVEKPEGPIKIPLSYAIHPMMKCLQHYTDVWQKIPETANPNQTHISSFIREEKMPEVEEEVRKQIDVLLKAELQNLKAREEFDANKENFGKKSKKKGKKGGKKGKAKGKKKGKKEKVEEPPPPPLSSQELEILFAKYVMIGCVQECPKVAMKDIIGDWEMLGSIKSLNKISRNSTMNEMKALGTELVLFPFAMTPETLENVVPPKRILLYGSQGVGKTLLTRALVTASNATFLTLSAHVVAERMILNGGTIKEVFQLARELQPSVIYIDRAELFFMAASGKKKKGKKKDKKSKKGAANDASLTPEKLEQKRLGEVASKLVDDLIFEMKSLAPADRVMVIGESSEPWDGNAASIADAFELQLHIPRPGHTALVHMWEKFILEMKGVISPSLDLSLLASRSDYYTPRVLRWACKDVLTSSRLAKMDIEPLTTNEFSSALLKYPTCEESEDHIWKEFKPALPKMNPEYIEVEVKQKK